VTPAQRRLLTGVATAGLIAATGWSLGGSAAAATESTASTDGRGLTFVAGAGQFNQVTINQRSVPDPGGGSFSLFLYTIDDVHPITAGANCAVPDAGDPTVVVCTVSEQPTSENFAVVRLGDKNDQLTMRAYGINTIYGGTGKDRLVGTYQDLLFGEDGDDTLVSTTSAKGGAGNDLIVGRGSLSGDDGNDVIVGDAQPSTIYGGTGNDELSGGSGKDSIWGNSGADLIRGGTYPDKLYGGPGDDTVYGNSGNDLLEGGPGRDALSGGPGADTVHQ
jgi:serralysin